MKRASILPFSAQRNMITTACTGTGCCSGYGDTCQ